MTKSDLRIVYLGTPEFAVARLRALVEGGYKVVAVVTMPDKPAGRGQKQSESAVKGFAISIAVLVVSLLLGQFTLILAQNGYLPPFIGGALPNIAFLGAGMWVMWAKR